MKFREERAYFGSLLEGTVHYAKKFMAAEDWDNWSTCICSQ